MKKTIHIPKLAETPVSAYAVWQKQNGDLSYTEHKTRLLPGLGTKNAIDATCIYQGSFTGRSAVLVFVGNNLVSDSRPNK